jgi:hypothetical protein
MSMLITHVKPAELWGKKVYDSDSHLLGEVVAIGSRRGVVRKVVVQRGPHLHAMRFIPPAETRVEDYIVLPAGTRPVGPPRLRLLH